jgi:NADH-quinone oxidoreductase subunit J
MAEAAVFWIAAFAAVGAGLAMVLARNAVHAALFLVGTQLALAVMFLLQGAFFIAALQIIVYAGAIMVLFIFVVMLLGVDKKEALVEPLTLQRPLAAGLGLLLIVEVSYLIVSGGFQIRLGSESVGPVRGSVENISTALFTNWALPFEVTSILLVVAIVGAMALAKRRLGGRAEE